MHVLAPARAGGLETVVSSLSASQCRYENDAQVAAVISKREAHEHPFLQLLKDTGVKVHMVNAEGRDYLGEAVQVGRLIRAGGVDVVHTHGYRADVVDGLVARRARVAHVQTLHGFAAGSARGRLYEWLQLRVAKHADAVIAVSKPLEIAARASGSARVHCIPNAIASDFEMLSRDVARRQLGLPAEGALVGWVGRLSPEKGPELFVSALGRAKSDYTAVLIGSGPSLSEVSQLAANEHIAGRVHLAGERLNARQYFRAFDILALTSRTEGTPMVLLEAMSAGVPIVATNVGGVPEVLADGAGVLVDPEEGSIATAIDTLIQDPEARQRLRERGAQAVARRYGTAGWVQAHDTVYQQALRRAERRYGKP